MAETTESRTTRVMLARVGALGGLLVGCRMFFGGRPDPLLGFQLMGIGGPGIALVSLAAALALVVVARNPVGSSGRLPLAALIAASPLLASVVPFHLALATTLRAIASTSVPVRDTLLAVGTAESTMCLVFGAAMTTGLVLDVLVTAGIEMHANQQLGARRAVIVWLGVLALLAAGTCLVLGPWADVVARGTTHPAATDALALVAAVDTSRSDAVFFAIALVLATLAASALTAIDGEPSGSDLRLASVAIGITVACVVVGFDATRRVNAARPDFYTRHLDAFAPLGFAGPSPGDGAAVVVVPGSLVDDTGMHPFDATNLARVAATARGFAIDARVDAASLRMLVDALGASGRAEIVLYGVAHRPAAMGRIRELAQAPYLGLPLPVASEMEVDLAPNEAHAAGRALRIMAVHGQAPRITAADGTPADLGEVAPEESVAVVLDAATTPPDLVAAIEVVRAAGGQPRVVASVASVALGSQPAEVATDTLGFGGGLGGLGMGLGTPRRTPDPDAGTALPRPEGPLVPADPAREGPGPVEIRAAMLRISPQVRACYETALRRTPDASGRADITLTIGPGGRPTRVEVATDTLPSVVTRCIERVLAAAEMPDPGPSGSTDVRFPFVFRQAGN